MTESTEQAIAIDSLSKTYHPRNRPPVQAVQGLSLSVPAGQVVGLLGSTGAGKTTIIKLIAGLIKPTAGRVRQLGHDLAHERDAARREIGVLLRGGATAAGRHSTWETLLHAGRRQGLAERDLVGRAEQLLHEWGLWTRRDDAVRTLPSAARQRVAFACVLLCEPPILLLDEPTWNLAVPDAGELIAALRAIRVPGRTIVLATSHLALACDLCDRVAILQQGRLVAEQAVPDLLGLLRQERYQIIVKGHLDHRWADWFDGVKISHTEQGATILSGAIADQAALHGLLIKVRDLNLPLLAVKRIEPDLDEVLRDLLGG